MTDRLDSWQIKTEVWREQLCKPLLRTFNFQPHNITTFRLFLAVSFPFLITSFPVTAWIVISISIILDAFDGTVARYHKIASDRGKFIDVLVDQVTFSLICLGLIRLLPKLTLVIATSAIFIPLVYLITMVYKNENKPSDWIIKLKARLTIYKIIFIALIVTNLTHLLSFSLIQVLLWAETTVVTINFYWCYHHFLKTDKI